MPESVHGKRRFVAIGAGLVGLSPLLPWVHVVLVGNVNLFSASIIEHQTPVAALILLVGGIALLLMAIFGSWRSRSFVGVALVIDALLAFVAVDNYVSVVRSVNISSGFFTAGIGGIVAIVGIILVAIGCFLVRPRTGENRAPQSSRYQNATYPAYFEATPQWHPDPLQKGWMRYWNGVSWTDHTVSEHGVTATPVQVGWVDPPTRFAGWKPDPGGQTYWRYWDGNAWTHNIFL